MTKDSILIIEKSETDQNMIARELREAGFSVDGVDSLQNAVQSIREVLPGLIMLDWILPRQEVLGLIRKLRSDDRTKRLPIMMLSAQGCEDDKVNALDAGADDYVTTSCSVRELVARVRAVLRRRTPHLSSESIQIGSLLLNPVTHHVFAKGSLIQLTKVDFRILNFFMANPGRMYTRTQLLDEIWGDHVYVQERTIDVHIRNLRAALLSSGNADRIETIRGGGYRFRGTCTAQLLGTETTPKRSSPTSRNTAVNQNYAFA